MRTRRQYIAETLGSGAVIATAEPVGRTIILEFRHGLPSVAAASLALDPEQVKDLIRALDKALTDLDQPDEGP